MSRNLQVSSLLQQFIASINRGETRQEPLQEKEDLTARRSAISLERQTFQPYVSAVPRKSEYTLNAPPEFLAHVMPPVWVYEGEAYDLTDFIKKHPGGGFFIGRMRNRDITVLLNVMHRNPDKVKKLLQKYSLHRKATPNDIHPLCFGVPSFLFQAGFDSWRDTPKFDFQTPGKLIDNIRERLQESEIQALIARMDVWFDVVTAVLGIAYILIQVLQLSAVAFMPVFLFVPLMVMLRICLSGAGHYLSLRSQRGLTPLLTHVFDVNYLLMAYLLVDGHTILHHGWSLSKVDPKPSSFTAIMELPRCYRIPCYTLHKFGNLFIGMILRFLQICHYGYQYGIASIYGSRQNGLPHYIGGVCARVLLCAEFFLFAFSGNLMVWVAQFVITIWLTTFMIFAGHNFDREIGEITAEDESDWAIFQIKNACDLSITGNKYIDCFLSAGLSPHRVHHVLPYQRSGFANIASEAIVREEAEKLGVAWLPPRNFFLDSLPKLIRRYLFTPSRQAKEQCYGLLLEHFHPQALYTSIEFIFKGFIGIGAL